MVLALRAAVMITGSLRIWGSREADEAAAESQPMRHQSAANAPLEAAPAAAVGESGARECVERPRAVAEQDGGPGGPELAVGVVVVHRGDGGDGA